MPTQVQVSKGEAAGLSSCAVTLLALCLTTAAAFGASKKWGFVSHQGTPLLAKSLIHKLAQRGNSLIFVWYFTVEHRVI